MTNSAMPLEYALVRSTVRLLAGATNGPPTSTGTGFLYKIAHASTNIVKVLIITNKHVIAGAESVQFILSSAPSLTDLDDHHQPLNRIDNTISCSLTGNTFSHPDPEVDLCGIDVTIPVGVLLQGGKKLRHMFIDSTWLPSAIDKANCRDVEQVLVIGYPRGLWDQHNNMPIARVGTTATHPFAKYQGKKNFLVDVAAFSGSSGSPVFAYEAPMFRQADGAYSPGTKAQFIGVIWGVVEAATEGELKIKELPSAVTAIPVLTTSLNLAIALHAEAIRELENLVFPRQ